MLSKLNSATVNGVAAFNVTIEVNITPTGSREGVRTVIVGLPDSSVKESYSRIQAALLNSNFNFGQQNIVINLAPGDIRKEGTGFDLPIAVGIVASNGLVGEDVLQRYMILGELSLDGTVKPIRGALPIAILARKIGYEGLIVPEANAHEAAVVNNLKVYGVHSLRQVLELLNGHETLAPTIIDTRAEFYAHQGGSALDFADVKGQELAKRAFEIAAAGGHNLIMVGPPGAGKSMLARRLPGIMPPLSLAESLETTQVHSVAGQLKGGTGLVTERPFRSPHHTVSQVALVGGGSNPMPGEISLAHNGVLFLDELPEFQRASLEVLRQPLEDRHITVTRAKYSIDYPANFMLVAAMNPCPCGYYNHPTKACQCTPGQIAKYMNRISGPLLDRIDIQIEITPLTFDELSRTRPGEPSAVIRERVVRARQIQQQRYRNYKGIHCNAQMTPALMREFATPAAQDMALLRDAINRLKLSARAYDRILRLARTIADLEGVTDIQTRHLTEAIGYRNLDRDDWAERRS